MLLEQMKRDHKELVLDAMFSDEEQFKDKYMSAHVRQAARMKAAAAKAEKNKAEAAVAVKGKAVCAAARKKLILEDLAAAGVVPLKDDDDLEG